MITILNTISEPNFFGVDLINSANFLELIIRFSFDLIVTLIIVRYIYFAKNKRKDYLFTYILIGITVFLLCILLDNVDLQLGFALGLFAIFGIIRYRTNTIPIKEMTYLFLIIGISVINALSNENISYIELIFTNLAIITSVFLLEKVFLLKHEASKTIIYEKIELIKPQNKSLLLEDLEKRTGLKINRIEIGEINFLRDTAIIQIYYYEEKSPIGYTQNNFKSDIINENDDD
ncbi:MAG: DUF4956 domain-containing protein [Bacteroidales bacterium]|nr:DUF4956 domain-containing protein [Bacteroidales bacterium]MBN2757730.1 DUF4956 domain-containing protein [Bacteroidales bacterium]